MASLLKRGKKLYVRVYVNSKAKDISTKTSSLQLAKKFLQKIEYENATGQLAAATRTPLPKLLSDFVAHLKPKHRDKSVKNDVSRLRTIFGPLVVELELTHKDELSGETEGKPAEPEDQKPPRVEAEYAGQITPPLINRYLDRRAASVGPKTLNADREILYRLFTYAIEHHGLIYPDPRLKNPVDSVRPRKLPAQDIRFLNMEQIATQLEAVKDDAALRAAVASPFFFCHESRRQPWHRRARSSFGMPACLILPFTHRHRDAIITGEDSRTASGQRSDVRRQRSEATTRIALCRGDKARAVERATTTGT